VLGGGGGGGGGYQIVGNYIGELLGIKQHKYVNVPITLPKVPSGVPTTRNSSSDTNAGKGNSSSRTGSMGSLAAEAWQSGFASEESHVAGFLLSLPHYAQLSSSSSSSSEASRSFEQDVLAATDAILAATASAGSSSNYSSSNAQEIKGGEDATISGDVNVGDSGNAAAICSHGRDMIDLEEVEHADDMNSGTDTDSSYHSSSSRELPYTGSSSPVAITDRSSAQGTSQPCVGNGRINSTSSKSMHSHQYGVDSKYGEPASTSSAAAGGVQFPVSTSASSTDGSSSSSSMTIENMTGSSRMVPSFPDYMAGAPQAAGPELRGNTSGTESEIDSSYAFNNIMWGSPDNKALSSSSSHGGSNTESSHGNSSSVAHHSGVTRHAPLDEILTTSSYDDIVMEYIGSHVNAAAAVGGGSAAGAVHGSDVVGSISSSNVSPPDKQQQQRGWKSWMVEGEGAVGGARGGIMARAASAITGLGVTGGGGGAATGSSSMEQPNVDTAILIPQEYLQVRLELELAALWHEGI
jgi:hypothetical protein